MALVFTDSEQQAAERLIELAFAEDLDQIGDLTCGALISPDAQGTVSIVARKPGVLAGMPIVQLVFARLDPTVTCEVLIEDGQKLAAGAVVAAITGPLRSLLTGERTALNFLTALSGVATLTRRFVDAVAGTRAEILDTRKTWPGWRRLQKYAVRAGGGTNHRLGLYDGILIKDNHLAAWSGSGSIADAIRTARKSAPAGVPIEVEVDTLEQLQEALPAHPDMVLLDNMPPEMLRQAIALRDAQAPGVLLEASGGITLENVAAIAQTGVERISVGALTHSAPALDLSFDWGARPERD